MNTPRPRAPAKSGPKRREEDDELEVIDVVDVVEEAIQLTRDPEVRAAKKVAAAEGGSIARYDPLQAYMRDIQKHALLKPEEEYELAVRYTRDGDLAAAARLVTSNLRLVVKIAYDYRRAYRNLLDLIQEGNIGLMQAVKKYDPYKGVKLSSYAAWWIRAYILRFILNNWRLVKLGTTQAQRKLFFNLKKEKARLAAMGIEASPELIAQRLDVSEEDVIQMDRRLSGGDVSLDAPVGAGEGRQVSRMDLLPARGGKIDDVLAEIEVGDLLRQKIHEFGDRLAGKEAIIFRDRLVAEDPRTLQQLGTDFGVSRERVRQLEKRLQQKLKQYLRDSLGEGILEA
jgi:RNA polymerase sigma-32 factor